MILLDFNRKQLEDTIDKVVERTMRMDMTWDWPCGVAYYGISKAYEITKKEAYLNIMKERIDKYITLGLPEVWTVNTCAMGHCLITLYQATSDQTYLKILESKIDYLKNDALRFSDHVLQHTVSANNDFPEQCWADTLFMAAMFLLRYGVMVGDQDLINDALHNYSRHIQYLQNEETGLWYHGYNHIQKDHMSGFYWGRANCWAAYTMSEVGKILPKAYLYPDFMDITGSLSEQLSAIKFLQTENGLWRTILDDPESYEEVSASCGIAAAMINAENPLYIEYINKAICGILENIAADGRVMNVSGGTAVMKNRDGYRNISKKWIQGWGQGMALTFFALVLSCKEKHSATTADVI